MPNKNDVGTPIPIRFLSDGSVRSITTEQGALARTFRLPYLINPNTLNLVIRGYAYYAGGYATHTREVLFGLENYPEINLGLIPLPTPIDVDPFCMERLNFYRTQASRVLNLEQCIELAIACPAHAQAYPHDKRKKTVMWTMVETPPLNILKEPGSYMGLWLDRVDCIWTPTNLDKRRLENITHTPIVVQHLGCQTDLYHPDVSPLDIVNTRNRFVFFVDATWSPRKGLDYIIEAYCKEFSSTDDVCLFLFAKYGTRPYGWKYYTTKWFYDRLKSFKFVEKSFIGKYGDTDWSITKEFGELTNKMLQFKSMNKMPTIVLHDVPVHENIMPNFYASAHCIVGASLGESTWLPGIQALAMNIPVIQMRDNWGGCGEYIPASYLYLYDANGVIPADDRLWKGTSVYYKGQSFPKPDVDALAQRMRMVYDDYKHAQDITIPIGQKIRDEWSWEEKLKPVVKRLKELDVNF